MERAGAFDQSCVLLPSSLVGTCDDAAGRKQHSPGAGMERALPEGPGSIALSIVVGLTHGS
jgi:hypothetical protein